MKDLLRDLYGHQAWADAEHWKALEAHPVALEDTAIRQRLYHIHLTQRALLLIVRGEALSLPHLRDFPNMIALKDFAMSNHNDVANFLEDASESQLEQMVTIPWFKDPPISLSVAQALLQAAMHSQYHRGQNATRLRELGGKPPLTDLIVWYWKGRPETKSE